MRRMSSNHNAPIFIAAAENQTTEPIPRPNGGGVKDSSGIAVFGPRNGGGWGLGFRSVYRFQAAEERALRTWSLVGDRLRPKVRATIFQPAKTGR